MEKPHASSKNGKPYARPAGLEDAIHVARNLRSADTLELMLLHGADADIQILLAKAFKDSTKCWAIIHESQPIGIFGVAPLKGRWGAPWLLATDGLPLIAREFIKQCPKYVNEMHDECPMLINYVHAENKTAINWLKHLGFTFMPAQIMGTGRAAFLPFIKTEKSNV